MKKTCKVVMLPTNEKANALRGYKDRSLLFNYKNEYSILKGEEEFTCYYHLYILSDDEIKKGDWGMGFAVGIKGIGEGYFLFKHDGSNLAKVNVLAKGSKKIIATTDKSLTMCSKSPIDRHLNCDGLADIPESFIKAYIKAQGKIDEVLVSYNPLDNQVIVRNHDNTVIIHQTKKYTREEVKKLVWESRYFYQKHRDLPFNQMRDLFEQWTKDNF